MIFFTIERLQKRCKRWCPLRLKGFAGRGLKENSRKRNSLEIYETENFKDVLHPEYPRIFQSKQGYFKSRFAILEWLVITNGVRDCARSWHHLFAIVNDFNGS